MKNRKQLNMPLLGLFMLMMHSAVAQGVFPFGWPLNSQHTIESSDFQTTLLLQGTSINDNPHLMIGTNFQNQLSLGVIQSPMPSTVIAPNSGFLGIGENFGIYNFFKDGESQVMSFGSYAGYGQVNVNGNFSSGPININKASGGSATFNEEGEIKYENGDFLGYTVNGWKSLTSGGNATSSWLTNGSDIYYNLGHVGVGLTIPQAEFHVKSQDALANLYLESSNGTNIRMYSHTASAGVSTTTNTPLSLGSGGFTAMNVHPNRDVDFFGDLSLLQDKGIVFGGFNTIYDDNGELNIFGDAIKLSTCLGGSGIIIEAGCEDFLNLSGGATDIFGFFNTNIRSGSTILFEVDNQNVGSILSSRWNVDAAMTIKQQGQSTTADGLRFQNDGNGDDYWNVSIGANDLSFYYDEDGPGTTNSFVLKALVDELDGSWDQFSDERLKEDIEKMDNVLPKLMALQPSTYRYKQSKNDSDKSIGFIAQNVQTQFPQLVNDSEEYLSISYGEMSVVAIKAIQEQQALIDRLMKTQEELIHKIEKLESEE